MPADLLTTIRAEIEARLGELRPLVDEYQELHGAIDALGDGSPVRSVPRAAAGSATRSRSRVGRGPRPREPRPREPGPREPRPRGRRPSIDAGGEAILAALEHGSHTAAELSVVTALPAAAIRESVRRLLVNDAIVKTDRERRTAYALSVPAV